MVRRFPSIPSLNRTLCFSLPLEKDHKLNDSIPYYGDLNIDGGSKKLILSLLQSIRTVVPVVMPPDTTDPENTSGYSDSEHIKNVLVLARKHSNELEGLFNPDELLRYSRYISDYQEIVHELEKLLDEVKTCRNSAHKFASGMAEMVEELIHISTSESEPPGIDSKPEKAHHHVDGSIPGNGQEKINFTRGGIKLKVV